jgi:hypothetical protein
MLSAMDDGIGKTIAALRTAGVEDNTLIVFFSDNGGPMGDEASNGSSNAPLRGAKTQTWEGGIRVPFIMRWKGRLPEGTTYTQPIIQLDIFPTALAAAGVAVQPDWKLDGVNLLPFLTGAAGGAPHEALYWRLGATMAVRKGPWKLLKWTPGAANRDPSTLTLAGAQLFHLSQDIGESTDLSAQNPDRVRELTDTWQRWAGQLMPPLWPAPRAGREAVRECAATRNPDLIASYAGAWNGRATGIASFTWTQHNDSTGTFAFQRDSTPVPTRVVFRSADSVVVEVTRPISSPQSVQPDIRVRIVALTCGDAMTGILVLTRSNELTQRMPFDATRP